MATLETPTCFPLLTGGCYLKAVLVVNFFLIQTGIFSGIYYSRVHRGERACDCTKTSTNQQSVGNPSAGNVGIVFRVVDRARGLVN